MTHRLSLDRIAAAPALIDPVFLGSPQFRCEPLEALLGCRLVLKVETVNPIRSFKGRGASVAVAGVPAGRPIVCASAGNFGQAVAYAGRARGNPVTVLAATGANALKIERMRGLGATVVLDGDDFDAAKAAARRHAERSGAVMIEDGRDAATAEGAGTIGMELLDWPEPIDALAVPLGNGALATGIGRWVKAKSPATEMIAAAAAGAPAQVLSWKAGRVIEGGPTATIADGVAVRVPVPESVTDMTGTIDDCVLVEEAAILQAMRLLHRHSGLVVEPAGAIGLAAILASPARFAGRLVATVICGSNLTEAQMRDWLG